MEKIGTLGDLSNDQLLCRVLGLHRRKLVAPLLREGSSLALLELSRRLEKVEVKP
ncbi:MAG: hypothetical protein GY838_17485 [bacterium]|nr:hypothetical protein [bacterium]